MTDIVISREAAIGALRQLGCPQTEHSVLAAMALGSNNTVAYQLARALQELWDACPEKRPVDKRVMAMDAATEEYEPWENGDQWRQVLINMLAAFDAKLAELEAGQ